MCSTSSSGGGGGGFGPADGLLKYWDKCGSGKSRVASGVTTHWGYTIVEEPSCGDLLIAGVDGTHDCLLSALAGVSFSSIDSRRDFC